MSRRNKSQPKSHDMIVRELEKRLSGKGRTVLTEFDYMNHGDHEADVLVLDYNKRYGYAIEVKTANSNKSRKKAYQQLRADRDYLMERHKIERVFLFYAYRNKSNIYTIKRVMR